MPSILGREQVAEVDVALVKVIIHRDPEGGFWAEVPSIPGCGTQGDTLEELESNLRDATQGCLSVDVHSGDEATEVATISV